MAEKNRIGALWVRTTKSGEEFFSGQLELADGSKASIVAFANNFKKDEKQPDFVIYESEERTGGGRPAPAPAPRPSFRKPVAQEEAPRAEGPKKSSRSVFGNRG